MKFSKDYNKPSDLPETLPVFPLAGALLLPRADLPLNIFEQRYLEMFSDAMSGDRVIGMIQPQEDTETGESSRLMKIGCAGRITSYTETPDGRMLITLTGVSRFSVSRELNTATPYRQVKANFKPYAVDLVMDKGASEVNRPALIQGLPERQQHECGLDGDQCGFNRSARKHAFTPCPLSRQ
jgi:uncharacterized protein